MKSAPLRNSTPKRARGSAATPATPTGPKRAQSDTPPPPDQTTAHWTFLTNHGHVLILLDRNPSMVLREVALQVGITERAVQRIIADLEAGGVIDREKVGRQNHYRIRHDQPLRHPVESHRTVGELLKLVNDLNP